jgi:DNA modification methylase
MAQENLFTEISENLDKGPVFCLGKTFHSEEERRAYFRNELRIKLPELKTIEGFPIGEDEDIINLSDPPYYTACPNPWLNDFIAEWEMEKENIKGRKKDFHVDEPYASDVSEGKNNPIYNAHTYHTKVPHPAIMRYILHYTQPGDIILDGFAGTGMTGVAGQICGTPDSVFKYKLETEFKSQFNKSVFWGTRNVICSDLSPVATLIAANYNSVIDPDLIERELTEIIDKVLNTFKWCYETKHHVNGKVGEINYMVWSEVFSCPNCNSEVIFYERAVNSDGTVNEEFNCSKCNSTLTKRISGKLKETVYDFELNKTVSINKFIPVLINYSIGGKIFEKKPDEDDLNVIAKINSIDIIKWLPKIKIFEGDKTGEPIRMGITHVNQLFFKRTLLLLSEIKSYCQTKQHHLWFNSQLVNISKLNRYRPGVSFPYNPLNGTYYIASQLSEANVFTAYKNKVKKLVKAYSLLNSNNPISTNSATELPIRNESVDYIFTDPPFGANIMYSELNLLAESWIKVLTNNKDEAIENKTQKKSTLSYQDLMTKCFKEYHRILKPGKWMTVEFSNTSAAVWNSIQTALQREGFIIANVAALDKQQGSFNAVTNTTSVKQDLIISCYKPSIEFESKFKMLQGDMAIWDFITEHLHHLPVHIKKDNSTTAIIERSPKILFDRLITFYLMRGLPVPIDARDFQEGLKQRFIERDGMYFTAEQAAEYDEKKAKTPIFVQLSLIVTNESDAIEWLKERLRKEAQKYQDIMPDFRIATQSLRKGDTLPELQDILNESFIQETDGNWRTPDPNEAKDREALRTKVLLKEFTGYVTAINQPKAKKLKEVRVEALRAGFKNSWEQKDFKTIITLGDKIPQNILLEDEQLLMYYDIAKDRI